MMDFVDWGNYVDNVENAIISFEEEYQVHVDRLENQFGVRNLGRLQIAAKPDGMIDDNTILEVVCTSKHSPDYLNFEYNRDKLYYAKMQLWMWIYQVQRCVLYIYRFDKDVTTTEDIMFDEQYVDELLEEINFKEQEILTARAGASQVSVKAVLHILGYRFEGDQLLESDWHQSTKGWNL